MFARQPDASKYGFVLLARQLKRWGMHLVDAQVYTAHLARFGARHWPRERYLAALSDALDCETRRGRWRFDDEAD